MIGSLIFLVLGMLLTIGGAAVLAFDFYLTFDTGLKLLPVYDMMLMIMGAPSMIDLQNWVQNTMSLEAWRETIKPMLVWYRPVR